LRHPHNVAQIGADTYGFFADLLDQLAADLCRESGGLPDGKPTRARRRR